MKDFLKGVFTFILLVVLMVGGVFAYFAISLSSVGTQKDHVLVIEPGRSVKSIINQLENEGFIKSATNSYFYYRFFGDKYNFIAGTYLVNGSLSTTEVFDYISNGSNLVQETVRITFQEGLMLTEYADKLAEATNLTKEELMTYWKDKDSYRDMMRYYAFLNNDILNNPEVKNLYEGYLFPQTYDFFTYTTCEQVTKKFLDYTEVIYNKYIEDFQKSQFSVNEIFTLASYVQAEGNTEESMYNVASVFINRITKPDASTGAGQRLESSMSICFLIGEKSAACELDSNRIAYATDPYNSYYHDGISPGPICAPGETAIKAVLNPANTNYYFFISSGSTFAYAHTYSQHQNNINKLLH